MKRNSILLATLAVALVAGNPAAAQDYTWTLSFMGGIGTALSESGAAEPGFQVGFGVQSEPQANIWLHAGQLDFETGTAPGAVTDGTITYVNVGGEYQFPESFYDSGVFLGLGFYDLESRRILAEGLLAPRDSESVLGLVIGATGEFKITPNFVFMAELVGHILDSDDMRVLGTAHAGLAFHF